MLILLSTLCAFALDLLLGDPPLPIPHTVVLMGRWIALMERLLRRVFPKTPLGELIAGGVLAVTTSLGAFGLSYLLLWLCGRVHILLAFVLHTFWAWQSLALRDLGEESGRVLRHLRRHDLSAARRAVGRIVGRDTTQLDEDGVTRAAVETVAENCSDGVIAPLCYLLLGGAPLALWYKAVNTMDSMVGYQGGGYRYFGRCAARLDDLANLIPARLSALLLLLAAWMNGGDANRGLAIWRRDRYRHASPNSGQCEAAMAGILGVRLGGPARYFGILRRRPTIGDSILPIHPEDIRTANRLVRDASLLALALLSGLRLFYEVMR